MEIRIEWRAGFGPKLSQRLLCWIIDPRLKMRKALLIVWISLLVQGQFSMMDQFDVYSISDADIPVCFVFVKPSPPCFLLTLTLSAIPWHLFTPNLCRRTHPLLSTRPLSVPKCSGSLCPQASEWPDGGLLQRSETCRGHRQSPQCLSADHPVPDQRYGE